MTETPKVGLKLKNFASTFLGKSLPPGVQEKKEKAWGQMPPPPPWVLKGAKCAGSKRVNLVIN